MNRSGQPPSIPLRFFRWFCNPYYAEDIEGDLLERYDRRLQDQGKNTANWHFTREVLLLFRPGIIRSLKGTQKLNYYGMLRHDLLMGWRSLLKNKVYSFLNVAGLSLGLSVTLLVALWVHDEWSFNQNHDHYPQIAKVMRLELHNGEKRTSSVMATGQGTLLSEEYGNHFQRVGMVRQRIEERTLANGEKRFSQKGYFMQPEVPEMLSLEMVSGSRQGLQEILNILLSQSLAEKLFGDQSPIGKVVKMDGTNDLVVTGVYKDLPRNSTYHEASFLAPLDYYLYGWSDLNVWDNYNMHILVQINDQTNFESASLAIKESLWSRMPERKPSLFLHPMENWHLYNEFENGVGVVSQRMKFVWFYGIVGVFILLLASINFMNLSTARASKRMKEIGVRKSMGAQKGKLIIQFLCESLIVTLLAAVLSLLITQITLPGFNQLSDKELELPWANYSFWLSLSGFILFTSLLSGSYPAFYLSSFDPVKSLKGSLKIGKSAALPRRVLVVFQFFISTVLIVGTLIVQEQVKHAKNRPAGYERDRLISLRASSPDYNGKYDILRQALKQTGVVDEIAQTNYAVTSHLGWNDGFDWIGKDPDYGAEFNTIRVTPEYAKTVGLQFTAGRDFSRDLVTDENAILINESAAALLQGLSQPIVGQTISFENENYGGPNFKIIGIVKDMVKGSPFEDTFPSILFPTKRDQRWLYIRIAEDVPLRKALDQIQEVYQQVIPLAPFDFKFADTEYNIKFQEEERIASIASSLSILAIIISCLGLFGLVSFVAEQKTKEIGIRKVLGATVLQLWKMLSREFVVLVLISCLIALPVGWYLMDQWVSQYDYRIQLNGWILVTGGLSSVAVTLLTVSFRAFKASTANPVDSLRDE